jgi:Tfp pilus assembly protein PilN
MNLLLTLGALFSGKVSIKLGVSRNAHGVVHALIAVNRSTKKSRVLSSGENLSIATRLFCPPSVNADLGQIPVSFTVSDITEEEAEAWGDHRTEDVIIPKGVASDEVITDFIIEDKKRYCAVVNEKTGASAIDSVVPDVMVQNLGIPLWNLAILYSGESLEPFVLWRISACGSVIGYIGHGRLQNLAHCFVDYDDLIRNAQEAMETVENMVRALSYGDTNVPVVIFSPEREFSLPQNCTLHDYSLKNAPSFKGIPHYCHEAYANASFGDDGFNLLPGNIEEKARKRNNLFNFFRSAMRITVLIAVGLFLFLCVTDGVLFAINNNNREMMLDAKAEIDTIKAIEKKKDELLKNFQKKMKFETGQSRCTILLSDLQSVFPEESWAEAISINEIDASGWLFEIQAFSRSSNTIGRVLESIRNIPGVVNTRMTYSEQMTLPDKSRGIRFKVKCEWK